MAKTSSGKQFLFAVNALVAWAAVGVSFTLMWTGYYVNQHDLSKPTLLGNVIGGNDTVSERFFDWSSYFTILSNIVVAIVMTTIVLKPSVFNRRGRSGTIWRALRLDSLLMITITGIVYNLLLAGGPKTGWDNISNQLQHVVNPIVTVAVFLLAGPRGMLKLKTIGQALILPIIWAVYVLTRGTMINAYPYYFFDVATYGWLSVITFIAQILAFAVVIGFIFLGYDKVASRK
jgi:hypothetical protein